jgi:hypothetical protein
MIAQLSSPSAPLTSRVTAIPFADVLSDVDPNRFGPNWSGLLTCVSYFAVLLIASVVIVLVWSRGRRRDDD